MYMTPDSSSPSEIPEEESMRSTLRFSFYSITLSITQVSYTGEKSAKTKKFGQEQM